MNKYNNPRLLNAVVSGTGMKHPIQPHVVVGDVSNGFIRGDLMDANAIVEHINNIIDGAPDTLDTLKEAADRIAALEHDTQDYEVNNTLANKVWNTMRGLLAVVVEDGPVEELAIVLNWNNTIFDPHDEGRYGSLEIGVATTERPGLMSTADKAALGAASAASAEIPQIKQTIEDNELTIAAALNDLNSRVAELEPLEDKKYFIYDINTAFSTSNHIGAPDYGLGYIEGNKIIFYGTRILYKGNSFFLFDNEHIYPVSINASGIINPTGTGPYMDSLPGPYESSLFPSIVSWLGGEIDSYEIELINDPSFFSRPFKYFNQCIYIPTGYNSTRFYYIKCRYIINTPGEYTIFNALNGIVPGSKVEIDGKKYDPQAIYSFEEAKTYTVSYYAATCINNINRLTQDGNSYCKDIELYGCPSGSMLNQFVGAKTKIDSITFHSYVPQVWSKDGGEYKTSSNFYDPDQLLDTTNIGNCPIYVKPEYLDVWRANDGWSLIADRIQPIPE